VYDKSTTLPSCKAPVRLSTPNTTIFMKAVPLYFGRAFGGASDRVDDLFHGDAGREDLTPIGVAGVAHQRSCEHQPESGLPSALTVCNSVKSLHRVHPERFDSSGLTKAGRGGYES
jgi:hypothetical protein